MTNSNYTELNQLYETYKDQGLLFEPLSLPQTFSINVFRRSEEQFNKTASTVSLCVHIFVELLSG